MSQNVKYISRNEDSVNGALRLGRNSRAQQMPRKHSATLLIQFEI